MKILSTSEIIGQDPVIFTVLGNRYSTEIAVQLLKQPEFGLTRLVCQGSSKL